MPLLHNSELIEQGKSTPPVPSVLASTPHSPEISEIRISEAVAASVDPLRHPIQIRFLESLRKLFATYLLERRCIL
jgi:hypothetical protein